MEHRYGERLPVNVPATVHKRDGEVIPVTIHNLSRGGAFVVVPTDRAVFRGLVELEVELPGTEPQLFLWRAMVIHRQGAGVGVMFDDRQAAERRPFLAAHEAMRSTGGAPGMTQ